MGIWEQIYRAITDTISEEDEAFELAYLRFGGARKRLVEHMNLCPDWLVLEIGYGQGYLTTELASALRKGKVAAIDLLHERYTSHVTRWIAKHLGLVEKIDLVNSDSLRLPFRDASFDATVSFLAFQDIKNTRGEEGVLTTIDEMCRVVKERGVVTIADDSFPCCRPEGDQGVLFDALKRHWKNLLPSTEELVKRMKKNGISKVDSYMYEPKERLLPKDAEREQRLSAKWAEPLGVRVDFDNFWEEVGEIVRKQGRTFSQLALLVGVKGRLD